MKRFFWRFWLLSYLSIFIFSYTVYGADVVTTPTGVCSNGYVSSNAEYLSDNGSFGLFMGSYRGPIVHNGISVPFQGFNQDFTLDVYGSPSNQTYLADGVTVSSYTISRAYRYRSLSSSSGTVYIYYDTVGFTCEAVKCPDGGSQLNGTCDRSCNDVGMGSLSTPIVGGGIDTICVDKSSNEQRQEECLIKCGSSANINSFSYNVVDGSSRCYCNEQEDNPIEQQTDSELQTKKDNGEDTLLAELNQQIRESNNTSNELSNDTNSLLSELIDSQTSNLDSLNTDLTSSLDTLNTDLTAKLDETNEILNDSKDIQEETKDSVSDIYDAISDYLLWFFGSNSLLEEEIINSEVSHKLSSLKTSISSLESDGYDFSEIDFKSGQKGFIDAAISKYSNLLGFGSSYGSKPSNIIVSIYGDTYTLLDFSLLDSFISILRGLFISIAYFSGFMIFIKKD